MANMGFEGAKLGDVGCGVWGGPARSGLEIGSDYGLLKKCQNEKMQFFMANRFPLLPAQNSANLEG